MARLFSVALFLAMVSPPAWGLDGPNEASRGGARPLPSRSFALPDSRSLSLPPGTGTQMWAGTEVGPNATFGLGMFGLKQDKSQLTPTTVREVDTRRTRRAGVGLSLRF